VPKTLTEAQVEALLTLPIPRRLWVFVDKTMLEVMYASGLRVSELVSLRVTHRRAERGRAACHGQGGKERLVPFGQVAALWLQQYLAGPRAELLAGANRSDDCL
jgi:integrase/recombinase XerD